MPAQSRQHPASSQPKAASVPAAPVLTSSQPAVNRKKAKRRAKEAAKKAHAGSGDAQSPSLSPPPQNGNLHVPGAYEQSTLDPQGYVPEDADLDDGFDTEHDESMAAQSKSKKKRKARKGTDSIDGYDTFNSDRRYASRPPPPMLPPEPELQRHSSDGVKPTYNKKGSRIWNTSTSEERENIKEFWLELDEQERRSLVKVEKEAVLKKMKEQQKHSCSCSVCGRKRTAIEEELEVLYDAYYDELEQYANNQVILEDGTVITGERAAHFKDVYPPAMPTGRLPPLHGPNGPQSRFQEEPDFEDENAEEVYSDDEAEYDDEDDYSDAPPQSAVEFFNFGKSLTVQGGILTVADDLLKNDGKKFIEMMEQLAERRMQREEEAQYAAQGLRHPHYHNNAPPLDEEDQYDDEDYATEEDDDYDDEDEEEAEGLTEEQRMEEGRRMFQIFAARMFEQRVLNAYREKVARERQERLLEELAEEENRDADRDAKKARDAAKKKAKKDKLKKDKEEARLKKLEQEQAAEAAAKAEEQRKAEEVRLKKEEQKRKKEEEKKRQEEEKQRKEDERRRKQAEARKAQEDAERKQKELKEKERMKKEELKKKEREERESKEREAKERREREAGEKKDRELRAKAPREQVRKSEQTSKGHSQQAVTPAPPLLRKQTSNATATPAPVQTNLGVQAPAQPSPHLQIATPVIPKAPSPARPRQASQQGSIQGSHQSSPKSSQVPSGSSATSPSTTQQAPAAGNQVQQPKSNGAPVHPHGPQGFNQGHHQVAPPPGMPFPGAPPGYGQYIPQGPAAHRFPPGFDPNVHGNNHFGAHYRGFPGPNGVPHGIQPFGPPGLNNMRPIGSGPPNPSPNSATSPHITNAFGHPPAPVGQQRIPGHSRQPSASLDKAADSAPAQPIGPPQSTKRLSSPGFSGIEEANSKQLGSSALLGDDEPEEPAREALRHVGPPAPFGPGSSSVNIFQKPFSNTTPFATPAMGFGHSPMMSPFPQGNSAGSWGAPDPFSTFSPSVRPFHNSKLLRSLICSSVRNLSMSAHTASRSRNGYHRIDLITTEVNNMLAGPDKVQSQELLDLCDTLGDSSNGGGSLHITGNEGEGWWVRYEEDNGGMPTTARGSIVGDIGSPMPSQAQPIHIPHQHQHQQTLNPGFMFNPGPPGMPRNAFGHQPMRGGFNS